MRNIILVILTLTLYSCAHTDSVLEVQHDAEMSFAGPIQEIESLSFQPANIEDNRSDKERIGWKKNGFGQNTANITTSQPVMSIVSDGIKTGLEQNNHIVSDDGRIKIEGKINKFWFDTDVNFWTVEFIGDTQCELVFIDKMTNEQIYKSTYSGSYSEKKGGGLSKTWQRIMSKAVDNLVEDIMFDEDLADALSELN